MRSIIAATIRQTTKFRRLVHVWKPYSIVTGSAVKRAFSDEQNRASAAAKTFTKEASTLFDKIISKEIPATIIYEDETCLAFNDIAPQAPIHFLVIPKQRIAKVEDSVTTDEGVSIDRCRLSKCFD